MYVPENVLSVGYKIANKKFTVKDFDVNNNLTNVRVLTLTEINQMLMVIPKDKFELHIKQVKE